MLKTENFQNDYLLTYVKHKSNDYQLTKHQNSNIFMDL